MAYNYEMYRATITAAIREATVATGNTPEDISEGGKQELQMIIFIEVCKLFYFNF